MNRLMIIPLMFGLLGLTGCAKSLRSYSELIAADPYGKPAAEGVKVTYLGTNGYLLQADGDSVLIDPYLSRYPLSRVALNLRSPVHERRLEEALAQAQVPSKIDAYVVTHGHFDHLMDVPELQRRLGGVVIASPSSCYLARGAGVAPGNLRPSLPGDERSVGRHSRVQVLGATHDLLFGRVPFPGSAETVPQDPPSRPSKWVCGPPLAFVIEMGGRRIYVESGGTMALLPDPKANGVDLAILGVSLPDSRRRYPAAVAQMKPRYVLPSHQDNFFLPLEKGFRFAGVSDFEQVLSSHRAKNLDAHSQLILMDFFKPWTLR